MTEEEWASAGDPVAMCDFVREATVPFKTRWLGWRSVKRFRVSDRKWRLLELACCKRLAERADHPWLRQLLPQARLFAEGRLPAGAWADAVEQITRWLRYLCDRLADFASPAGADAARRSATALGRLFAASPPGDGHVLQLTARAADPDNPASEFPYQILLVRDILGNPFRPESLEPAWLRANGRIAERLAREIDECCSYEDMPILGDALEDAGCDREAILAHCREAEVHVCGCWVLDLLLGKT